MYFAYKYSLFYPHFSVSYLRITNNYISSIIARALNYCSCIYLSNNLPYTHGKTHKFAEQHKKWRMPPCRRLKSNIEIVKFTNNIDICQKPYRKIVNKRFTIHILSADCQTVLALAALLPRPAGYCATFCSIALHIRQT